MIPWRNLGASGPWREIKRRVVSFAAPDVGGGGGGLLGWVEYGRDREIFMHCLQVLASPLGLRGVNIVWCLKEEVAVLDGTIK
jgi:hypothetical protein